MSITPDAILQLGLGFWGSKTLLSAVELGLFSELAKGPRDLGSLPSCKDPRAQSCVERGSDCEALVLRAQG
jgi:hypothetical protein